jgi:di/tricarboxylate transporter
LWRYWNSLFLLIAIMLIAAGLVTALPAISGFGWALLAFTGLVLVLRTILWDFMRAGRWRAALAGIAIVITAGIFLFGLWEIRALVVDWWMAVSQARTRG